MRSWPALLSMKPDNLPSIAFICPELVTVYRTASDKTITFVVGTPSFFLRLSLAASGMSLYHKGETESAWAQRERRSSARCPIKGCGGAGRGRPGKGMRPLGCDTKWLWPWASGCVPVCSVFLPFPFASPNVEIVKGPIGSPS